MVSTAAFVDRLSQLVDCQTMVPGLHTVMPSCSSHGRSKVFLLISLVASGAVLLTTKSPLQQRPAPSPPKHRGWDIGKVLRAPDTLFLQSINRITEYFKLKLLLRGNSVSAKAPEFRWLNDAKEEICHSFGISPVPELWICDDSRMLAQAGPHGCRGFGKGWVVLSKGVLEMLPREDVVAVLAHELTHVAENHHLKRGYLILDFYRLMLLWSLKQKDSAVVDLETAVSTLSMWLLLGLRSRRQEMEADRHMLDVVRPAIAFDALARMHYPLEDPREVLHDAKEALKLLSRLLAF